ncbi:hypothetical protein [Luteipulveratus halotolerans]|uniref:hypothetical protein n=1 Tax=Luteipulveratus halotolerans TaxID=1631356 RepID=UPI0012FC9ECD|nr:hypothetical protein [Luteipulveratus halotolerans]
MSTTERPRRRHHAGRHIAFCRCGCKARAGATTRPALDTRVNAWDHTRKAAA